MEGGCRRFEVLLDYPLARCGEMLSSLYVVFVCLSPEGSNSSCVQETDYGLGLKHLP
jgi:hypothetical protein